MMKSQITEEAHSASAGCEVRYVHQSMFAMSALIAYNTTGGGYATDSHR